MSILKPIAKHVSVDTYLNIKFAFIVISALLVILTTINYYGFVLFNFDPFNINKILFYTYDEFTAISVFSLFHMGSLLISSLILKYIAD